MVKSIFVGKFVQKLFFVGKLLFSAKKIVFPRKSPKFISTVQNFPTFQSIDSAVDALKSQHGKSIRPDSKRCQIGYGRSQPSSRLWVGGLGDWTTKDMLMKEFDRYGVVEKIEYSRGDRQAYIKCVKRVVLDSVIMCERPKKGFI